MLLTDARRAARTDEDGWLVQLDDQRRELWNSAQITEGVELLTRTLAKGRSVRTAAGRPSPRAR